MEVTPQLLNRVALDNIRDHQIGGQTDGITEDVAADLGFTSYTPTETGVHAVSQVSNEIETSDHASHSKGVELSLEGMRRITKADRQLALESINAIRKNTHRDDV